MRDYGRVYSSFWTSSDVHALSDDARLLALYLLSGPHGTIAGVCRLPDGYVSEDLGWPSQRVAKGFRELFAKGFAYRCETTKWVFIRKFLQWNRPENPNQWKAAKKIAESIPAKCNWRCDFVKVFEEISGLELNPLETLTEGLLQPLPTQDQDQEQYQEEEREGAEAPRAPKNSNGKSRRPSRQAPKDFDPDPSVALSRLPDMDVDVEIQKLRDWEFKTPRSNWPAVWRNWVQRCVETGIYAKKANGNGSKPSLRFLTGPEEYELWKQLTADGQHWDTQEQWDEFYRHRVA